MFVNLVLEYGIWKSQTNQEGLKLHGTNPHLLYIDDVNLYGKNKSVTYDRL
jgi:hypothetical protein